MKNPLFNRDKAPGGWRDAPAARVVTAAAFIWLCVAAAVVILVLREREATIDRAIRNFSALALVLESHTARTFQAVDMTLAGAIDALRLADDLEPDDAEFREALIRRLQSLRPYARAIYIVDADGRIVHDTDHPATPAISPARRPYFQRHKDDPKLVSSIGAPLESHAELGWFVAVTHRIGTDDRFAGIAVAAVQPRYFEELYQRMGLGVTEIISLYYEDGVLISQYPDAGQSIGRSFADFPLFSTYLPQSAAGSYITRNGPLPFEVLVSYRAVQSHPLVVAVTQDLRAVLAPWRLTAMGAVVALALLLVLLALLVDQFRRQQRARERIQERHAKAERMQALGHLTSGVAHDFNNLLGVVASSLAVITQTHREGESRSNALAAAERAVARGTTLIQRLSTFARSQPMHVKSRSLNACVRASSALLQRAAGSGVEFLIELAEELPPCLFDETELEVALVNLVINARDAMSGAGRIALRTYARTTVVNAESGDGRTADRVCIAVEDSGPGMSEQVQRHAFEPYFTTKGDQGTGLGLAQVYGFMMQVGGEAHIESRPGIGTRVELMFRKA